MTGSPAVRLDKWLFFARFFKTRSLAARMVSAGGIRVNGARVTKPAASVRDGDTLAFSQGRRTRVVVVRAPGERRGPAAEAELLYEDRSPPPAARPPEGGPRYDKGGRPTKKDRREMDAHARERE